MVYNLTETFAVFAPEFRGERLVKSAVTHFEPKLNKILTHYNGDSVYGFTSTEYISPAIVENYVANPNTFTSTVGWGVGKAVLTEGFPDLVADTYPTLSSQIISGQIEENPSIYLKFTPEKIN
jgi:hypothetical protein